MGYSISTRSSVTMSQENATPSSEQSASNSTSNENPYRLTPEQSDEMIVYLKQLIRDGVIQNTQFKIDEPTAE